MTGPRAFVPSDMRPGQLAGTCRKGQRDSTGILWAVEDADDLVANLIEIDPERLEDAGGDSFALSDEPQEEMLRADVVVAEPSRFVDRELDDSLGPGR